MTFLAVSVYVQMFQISTKRWVAGLSSFDASFGAFFDASFDASFGASVRGQIEAFESAKARDYINACPYVCVCLFRPGYHLEI